MTSRVLNVGLLVAAELMGGALSNLLFHVRAAGAAAPDVRGEGRS